jgi:hypothetical protein
MANPVVTSISFDKTTYSAGQVITATVDYTQGTGSASQNFTATATDSVSGLTGALSSSFSVVSNDSTTVTVSDSGSRTWTKVSDSGSVAVFTATA